MPIAPIYFYIAIAFFPRMKPWKTLSWPRRVTRGVIGKGGIYDVGEVTRNEAR